ncbi:MAG: nucleoside deaminase [Deltaproteobacteria bacterium]|nr:nucleoside deaminase [Deltaproteobacteria bacterium]
MRVALAEAARAGADGEVPVGAALVVDGALVACACNRTLRDCDPTAHAEIVVLRKAATAVRNHRIGGVLYVTLEPCLMCMGALVQARIERVVFAAPDPKAGAAVSLYRVGEDVRLNHRFAVEPGPFGEESAGLLRDFFRERRAETA